MSQNKPKIAFLHISTFPAGGAEKVTSDLALFLSKHGYEIHVITGKVKRDILSDTDKKNIIFHEYGSGHFKARQLSQAIIDVCNAEKFDILINQSYILRDIPFIRRNISCKIVYCNHGQPFWEVTSAKANQQKRKRSIINILRIRYSKISHNIERRMNRRYGRMMRNCDAYITLCDAYLQEIKAAGFRKYLPEYSMAISNSIPKQDVNYSLDKKKQVIFLGRLTHSDKRVDRLLNIWHEVYRRFPEWELLIVGDGEERSNLEALAADLELDRVKFCGWTTSPETYLQDAAILCMTSEFEGLPLVLAQAQQAGVVPIAFNCSAGVEYILAPSGVNGELINPNDTAGYIESLSHLMSNEDYRKRLQANCIEKAKTYDIDNGIGQQWLDLFDSLLRDKG